MQITCGLIKPGAVKDKHIGEILAEIERNGLRIVGLKMFQMSREIAERFYAVHAGKPFFEELVASMTSSPIVAIAIAGENAIQRWRDIMGATDPAKAAEGTIRRRFGKSIGENATHGSDSPENAQKELSIIFSDDEIFANLGE